MKKPGMPHLEWHDQNPNTLVRVYCHRCGTIIQGLVADEHPIDSTRINGEIVKTHLALMALYPTYQEITLKMSDGSQHVMAVCRACASAVSVAETTQYYKRDIAAFKDESSTIGHEFKPFLAQREPVDIIHRERQDEK